MEKLLVVSADGHAVMPPDLWSEYLDPKYHEHLPQLVGENELWTWAMTLLNDLQLEPGPAVPGGSLDDFDTERRYRDGGWTGAWDADMRLREMDREGVAAEFVFHGFFRAVDLFYNVSNFNYPPDVAEAGVRAYNRWAHDTFGAHPDRLLLTGAVGRCVDRDVVLRELEWIADHGFAATYMPGFTAHPDQVPLDDDWWDPVWSFCEERGLVLVAHAGYGFEPGLTLAAVEAANQEVRARGGDDVDFLETLRSGYFNDGLFADLKARRPFWQLALSGVFDRHPDLRFMFTEIRADWIPSYLRRLDDVFEERPGDFRATRPPSEYWHSNCMAGLSFMHRAEVEMRDEIGVDTLSFGRDYPHTEATWPNTGDYLRTLFAGVPEPDVRAILGENLARFMRLDRDALGVVVERIGLTPDQVVDGGGELPTGLRAHLDRRCGLSKPAERDARVGELEPMLAADLVRLGA
jgi:predicted TIM-barrel fold metal-dependent hydrolase